MADLASAPRASASSPHDLAAISSRQVVALLSLQPLFVLAMAATVASCAVHMLGWMWLTSTSLNFISLIPLSETP